MSAPIPVAKVQDIAAGKAIVVKHGREDIAIFNLDGAFYACSNRCPHAGAPLQNSFISGTVITCPWHGWRFDLAAGPDAPKDGVERYPVTVDGDDVLLHLSEAG
ncbi:MAG: Rieske 2Fe-2S domain-containing protein [Candidatus Hydrogenedentes bacterium]|nr:Rieske 2Fe-2S domain-containing protein [Candidatus Hydrogenedentota bacterium]